MVRLERCRPGGQLGEDVGLPPELVPETLVLGDEKRDYITVNFVTTYNLDELGFTEV